MSTLRRLSLAALAPLWLVAGLPSCSTSAGATEVCDAELAQCGDLVLADHCVSHPAACTVDGAPYPITGGIYLPSKRPLTIDLSGSGLGASAIYLQFYADQAAEPQLRVLLDGVEGTRTGGTFIFKEHTGAPGKLEVTWLDSTSATLFVTLELQDQPCVDRAFDTVCYFLVDGS